MFRVTPPQAHFIVKNFLSCPDAWSSFTEPSFKSEISSGLPAPPQMPLPEIPHPWLVRPYLDTMTFDLKHASIKKRYSAAFSPTGDIMMLQVQFQRFGGWNHSQVYVIIRKYPLYTCICQCMYRSNTCPPFLTLKFKYSYCNHWHVRFNMSLQHNFKQISNNDVFSHVSI